MAPRYQLRLKDHEGNVVAINDHFISLRIVKTVNSPGFYELVLGQSNTLVPYFLLDAQIEMWRSDPQAEIDWYVEFEAFHRTVVRQAKKDGERLFRSYGSGYADLLWRRIIAGYAGTAYTDKSGVAETVAKEFVNEQASVGAGDRGFPGFYMQADAATGSSVELKRAWDILGDVLREISRMGGGDFAVVGTGPATFEFRWYDGQLGEDRSEGNTEGNPPIIFSIDLGNMALPIYSNPRSDEINLVYVGGEGEGTNRNVITRQELMAILDSPWNRREIFRDARNESTTAALEDKGDEVLEEEKKKESFWFEVIQTAACRYGRDYFLGDLVTARYMDVVRNKKIVSVKIEARQNRESISLVLADVP